LLIGVIARGTARKFAAQSGEGWKMSELTRNNDRAGPATKGGARSAGRKRQGRGRPRRDQAGQLDAELLRHALDHFLEKGFEATTMTAITRSLGMSKQTVYARYSDKHALFRAALQSAIDEWLAPAATLHELEDDDDLEATLVAVARALVTTMLSPTGVRLIRITNAESFRMPEIGRETYGRGHELFARYLRDLFARRLFAANRTRADIEDFVTAFLNLISGPARLNAWGLDAAPIAIDEFVRRRVRLFLAGALRA
jgi:TetR/AcrR family transcriptional regulator, mexJK operon transcriptional repressor